MRLMAALVCLPAGLGLLAAQPAKPGPCSLLTRAEANKPEMRVRYSLNRPPRVPGPPLTP